MFHHFSMEIASLHILNVKLSYLIPFFAKQCFLVMKNNEISPTIFLRTNKYLSNVTLTKRGIEKILLILNPNKAHGHDSMSIRILQICAKCICKPYEIIYKPCFEKACFRSEWKKANVVPVHHKGDRRLLRITAQC